MRLMNAVNLYTGLISGREEAVNDLRHSMQELRESAPDYNVVVRDIAEAVEKEFEVGTIQCDGVKELEAYKTFIDGLAYKVGEMLDQRPIKVGDMIETVANCDGPDRYMYGARVDEFPIGTAGLVYDISGDRINAFVINCKIRSLRLYTVEVRKKTYVEIKKKLKQKDLEKGDIVKTIMTGGKEPSIYSFGGRTDFVPIGTMGIVVDTEADYFTALFPASEWRVRYHEVHKVEEERLTTAERCERLRPKITEIVSGVEQFYCLRDHMTAEQTIIQDTLKRFNELGIEREGVEEILRDVGIRFTPEQILDHYTRNHEEEQEIIRRLEQQEQSLPQKIKRFFAGMFSRRGD
ncbi:TPA: hypothetical protein HA265_01140 [Candidatus Woesearchaeota archaeon]|nr:hypothetical protein [Candidatus Woesearchaeota archaeon]